MAFKFPTLVENISDIPAEFQPLYVKSEDDDSATLIEDLRKRVEATESLQKALTTERKTASDRDRELRAWRAKSGADTADALAELIAQRDAEHEAALAAARESVGDKDGDLAKRIEQVKEDAARKHAKEAERLANERDAANKRAAAMQASMEKTMCEGEALRAISSHKGNLRLLKPHVLAHTKVVEEDGRYILRVVDEDGEPKYDGDGKEMSVDSFVSSLKGTDDFMAAFEPDGATGGGARPRSPGGKGPAKNPWSKEHFNLTEQMRISKENPAMAAALKTSSGR